MLSNLSFDDYLEAGGWRGYAQKAAKDAFITEARSSLEPLQKMLDTEQARLLTLENTTADDFLLVVAIKRQLGTLKRHLKISSDDARYYRTVRARAFSSSPESRDQENSSCSSASLRPLSGFAATSAVSARLSSQEISCSQERLLARTRFGPATM
jgi:hypothetical protein